MPVDKGFFLKETTFGGRACTVTVQTFVHGEMALVITDKRTNLQHRLAIKNPEINLLPQLKEMYPEWFTNNDKECHV